MNEFIPGKLPTVYYNHKFKTTTILLEVKLPRGVTGMLKIQEDHKNGEMAIAIDSTKLRTK